VLGLIFSLILSPATDQAFTLALGTVISSLRVVSNRAAQD
jgi:hypothetical protein